MRGRTWTWMLVLTAMTSQVWIAKGEWSQWRGPHRDGVDLKSPALTAVKPDGVLKPIWQSEKIPSGREGGWGSPVVSNGRVYLFAHQREQLKQLGKPKYPWIPPDKRGHLTPKEYEEYEKNRRDEDEARGKAYRFTEVVYCIDLANGKTVWKKSIKSIYTRFVQSGTIAVHDEKLYFLGAGFVARCLDAKSGDVVWETKLPGEFRDQFMMSSFAIADGVAVAHCGHLFGLDANKGGIIWEGDVKDHRGTHTSPIVWRHGGKSYIIVNAGGNDTVCLGPRTGKELWRVDSDATNATPVLTQLDGADVLVTYGRSRRGGLRCYRIQPSGAKELWTYHGCADKGSSPVVVDGHVYVQGERRLACVELKSGAEKWTTLLNRRRPEYTSLVAADGKVCYALEGALWFSADPSAFKPIMEGRLDDGAVIASTEVHESRKAQKVGKLQPLRCASPALVGGKMILRLPDGLVCYDLAGKLGLRD